MKARTRLKTGRSISFHIIFFLLLFSCVAPVHTQQESTQSLIDVGTFVLKPPSGPDWKMEIDRNTGFVKFAKDKASLFFMTITVREFTIDKINSGLENEIADKIRSDFEQVLKEGETGKKYDLKSVEKDVLMLKEKKYYTLFYKKWPDGFMGKATEYGKMFLYVPPSYERSYKCYGFVLTEIYPRGMVTGPAIERNRNLNIIHEMLDSFEVK